MLNKIKLAGKSVGNFAIDIIRINGTVLFSSPQTNTRKKIFIWNDVAIN